MTPQRSNTAAGVVVSINITTSAAIVKVQNSRVLRQNNNAASSRNLLKRVRRSRLTAVGIPVVDRRDVKRLRLKICEEREGPKQGRV